MDNEQQTIRRAIEGDEAALRSLWTRHAPHIDMVVRRLVGFDEDLAEDIAQEVWIQIFRALPGYRGDSQFSTWAHRIAVNRTLNALRRTKRLAAIEVSVVSGTGVPGVVTFTRPRVFMVMMGLLRLDNRLWRRPFRPRKGGCC